MTQVKTLPLLLQGLCKRTGKLAHAIRVCGFCTARHTLECEETQYSRSRFLSATINPALKNLQDINQSDELTDSRRRPKANPQF